MKSQMKKRNNVFRTILTYRKEILNTVLMCAVIIAFGISLAAINIALENLFENDTKVKVEDTTAKISKVVVDREAHDTLEITPYSNLKSRIDLSADQLDLVLNYYTSYRENENSIFKDKGYVFYEASNETGLDPIFLITLAVNIYGWDYTADDMKLSSNDITPNQQFEKDIMQLANNIYDIWYIDRGCHTIDSMVSSDEYKFAESTNWAETIACAMDNAYKIIY